MALLRFDPAQVDPRYFLYYYLGPEFRKIIEKHTIHGATVNRLPLKAMPQWEIRLPEVEQQRAIAEVLGALDAKIVANRKLAETTDSFVRALFEEAGARSRERRTVAQLVTNIRETVTPAGVSESSSYVGLEHISRRQMWLSEDGDPADVQSAKSKFQRGDVLFGKLRPYFHKVATATTEGICSTDILVLRPTSDAIRGWALATLTSDEVIAAVVASSEGTRMPRASWKDLSAVQVPWPGESEARAISAQVENLRSIALAAVSECQVLAVTRDALLPNLMSGELRVRDAERFVAQVL
jgi:type I restriction enzyme S subunit